MLRKATKQEFKANRRAALERDGYQCRVCGSYDNLECHHIIPYRRSLSHAVDNLATLCQHCHRIIDGND